MGILSNLANAFRGRNLDDADLAHAALRGEVRRLEAELQAFTLQRHELQAKARRTVELYEDARARLEAATRQA